MTNLYDPLEERMISDLSGQLDQALRPFDAAAVARHAAGDGARSVLRIVGATAVVAIAAVTTIFALEAVTGARNQMGPDASGPATSSPTGSPAAGLQQLASIQRADQLINSRLTPEEHAIVGNAQEEVVETCMQELGWDFELGTHSAETGFEAWPSTLSQLDQWTFADVASAEAAGYGLESYLAEHSAFLATLDEMEGEAHIPDQATMSPEDSARFEIEYFGTEEERIEIVERDGSGSGIAGGGCLGRGYRAIYGDDLERWRWLDDARGTAQADIWEATFADDAVVGAADTWRRCIRDELGMELADPPAAFDVAMSAAQSVGDYERERVVATADARCKEESRLDLAVQAAFLAATNAVLPEFEADLIALQDFENEALARATQILTTEDGD